MTNEQLQRISAGYEWPALNLARNSRAGQTLGAYREPVQAGPGTERRNTPAPRRSVRRPRVYEKAERGNNQPAQQNKPYRADPPLGNVLSGQRNNDSSYSTGDDLRQIFIIKIMCGVGIALCIIASLTSILS